MDGVLLVDKPGGMTSHDVVGRFRRLLNRRDIGHAGTLDPMATGLLVLLVGKATKISDYILNGDKSYETTVRLGVTTDTDDITGEIVQEKNTDHLSLDEIRAEVNSLTGPMELKVPIYSAIKVKGKKLYEKARKGESFEPPLKKMDFQDLEILSLDQNKVSVRFRCSKGSYVRAWGKTLGEKLGCGATLESLRRVHSSPYDVNEALKYRDQQEIPEDKVYYSSSFIPLNHCLPNWPMIKIEGLDEKLISNGQISRRLERFMELEFGGRDFPGIKLSSKKNGRLIALINHEPPLSFKIRRIFPAN